MVEWIKTFQGDKRMYKCAIFDLDGTLADTLKTISYFANKALSHFSLSAYPEEEYKYMVGNGAKILVERMLKNQNAYSDEMHEKVFTYYNKIYDEDFLYLTASYPGIPELLKFLKENGMKIGALSNKPHYPTTMIIENIFEKGTFDLVFGQRENYPIKPDPKVLLKMLEEWNIKPEECLYIGDTKTDMKTGKNAGAFTIGVLWGFRDKEELVSNNADFIAKKPADIIEFIKKGY